MNIDSANITTITIWLKMIMTKLVPLSLKCAFFVLLVPYSSIFVQTALITVAHDIAN